MSGFTPTAEQEEAREKFDSGKPLVIQAGAGTGKTSTLVYLAHSTPRNGQYVAFNRAIVQDSMGRFPRTVAANTAHSLAFRAVGNTYAERLRNSRRVRNEDIARTLGIDPIEMPTGAGNERRKLAPAFLAGHVMRAIGRFCQTADEVPGGQHVPYIDGLDLPSPDGRRGWANNDQLRRYLAPFITRAWLDLCQTRGQLRFGHDTYLKLWHLSDPRIGADFILFDEAQDANPVMAAIVEAQEHAQRVYVGDGAQAIYEWTGAIDAMDRMTEVDGAQVAYLSQSFRFGPAVAAVANRLLSRLDTPLRLRGLDSIASTVTFDRPEGQGQRPDAVLCRTNAAAVRRVLEEQQAGGNPYLVGEGKEVLSFAEGAQQLMERGFTSHPELACFGDWGAVQNYVAADPMGHELKLLVRLVDEFGCRTIRDALGRLPRPEHASIVVTTAHKAKGREWPRVELADDFPVPKVPGGVTGEEVPDTPAELMGARRDGDPSELRLLYVAVTRARQSLDLSHCPLLVSALGLDKEGEA